MLLLDCKTWWQPSNERHEQCLTTSKESEGPFYIANAPYRNGTVCEDRYTLIVNNCKYTELFSTSLLFRESETLIMTGQVMLGDCSAGVSAVLDLWQGIYY